ncbi:NUDIX domain-containing protein [Pseudooceanicola onchidii]|uniref:NUDIX domain-containing protein n=1 Tax=Pseudooceanicola onchidii TaxID=2562279 RepID=UPI0010AB26A4|nr:NUDIX hydrolase [Pseudooceanicola onchidii]
MRRYGHPPEEGTRYTPRAGVYAILPQGGSLLLTHQAEPDPEFQLPGGGVDPGESPLRALHREVYEETGWHIADARRVGVYKRYAYMPEYDKWAEKLCTIYVARPVRPKGAPTEPGHSAIWMPADMAVDLMADPGSVAMVARLIR